MGRIADLILRPFRIEDEDPDRVEGYREGPQPLPPQELDNDIPPSENVYGGRADEDGVCADEKNGRAGRKIERASAKNGPYGRERRAFGWWRKPLPKDEIDAMWWAKAARSVVWKGSYPLRIAGFLGGAVAVTVLAANAAGGGWFAGDGWGGAKNMLAAILVFVAYGIITDPFAVLCRRFAPQSRALLGGIGIMLGALASWPSWPLFVATCVYTAIVLVVVGICNTEWLVAVTYLTSPSIYDAMRRDPKKSAMKSWDAGGARKTMTFCSEYGTFITSPYLYRMAQGIYTIAWLLGHEKGEEDAEAELLERDEGDGDDWDDGDDEEETGRKVCADGYVFSGLTQEDYDDVWNALKSEREAREEDAATWSEERGELLETLRAAQVEKQRLLQEVGEAKKQAEEARTAADREREGSKNDAVFLRIGRIRYEYDNGSRSARAIAKATGYPASTVQDLLRRWKAMENGEGIKNLTEGGGDNGTTTGGEGQAAEEG